MIPQHHCIYSHTAREFRPETQTHFSKRSHSRDVSPCSLICSLWPGANALHLAMVKWVLVYDQEMGSPKPYWLHQQTYREYTGRTVLSEEEDSREKEASYLCNTKMKEIYLQQPCRMLSHVEAQRQHIACSRHNWERHLHGPANLYLLGYMLLTAI